MKKKLLIAVIAILCVALLGACGSNPPEEAIIGTWECQDDTIPHSWMCLFTFDENGRFVDKDGDAGDFRIDGDSLTLAFDNFDAITVTFEIRSNRLTLTGDGIHVRLTRQ